jgi:4-hydroxythreonine-4-phosphate dehydrogenase
MLPLALSLGEPAGIGIDLTLKLWTERKARNIPAFFLAGDAAFVLARAKSLSLQVTLAECAPEEAAAKFETALPLVASSVAATAKPGEPDGASAAAARASIDLCVSLVQAGKARGVVTNPIAKHVMQSGGFNFPGHTEYLAHLSGAKLPVMLIWSEMLAVIPVTIHLPLRDVPNALTTELIVESGRIAARDYRARFGIANPRLAVCGLNPHAGE